MPSRVGGGASHRGADMDQRDVCRINGHRESPGLRQRTRIRSEVRYILNTGDF